MLKMLLNSLRLTVKCVQSNSALRSVSLRTVTHIQKYSNWSHRTPVCIVNEEEILENIEAAEGPNEFIGTEKRKPLKVRGKKSTPLKKKKKIIVPETEKTFKEDGHLNFESLKENDQILT